MPSSWMKAGMSVVGLVKINSSTSEDGLDYEELRTVTGLQQLDQVSGEPLQDNFCHDEPQSGELWLVTSSI
jgi:hypothetical protein